MVIIMNKYKLLFSNIIIFSLGGISSKVLIFLLLPLYTGVLSTTEYGNIEIINTTVIFLIPILSLSINEAVLRFTLDISFCKKSIFSNGSIVLFISTFIFIILLPILRKLNSAIDEYVVFFTLLFILNTLQGLFFNFSKGLEKVKSCAISGILQSITTVSTNILFLLVLKLGIEGYLLSLLLSPLTASLYLFINCKLWRFINIKSVDKIIIKDLLMYSIPFIPTAIAWWINTTSDRYILSAICGFAATGLYSAAYKLPNIMSVLTSVFQQAWQISGVKSHGDDGYEVFYSNIYRYFNIGIVILGSIIICFTKIIAQLLFLNDFYEAWKFVPFLIIGAVFSGVSGVLGTIFLAVKKTKDMVISTATGAIINVIMNFLLLNIIGPIGAAISTAISFFIVWLTRFYTSKKYITIRINNKKILLLYFTIFCQAVITSFNIKYAFIINVVSIILLFVISYKEIFVLRKELINLINVKNKKDELVEKA